MSNHRYCGKYDCSCTFASHEKSKYLHPTKNGNIDVAEIGIGSSLEMWFKCQDCGHDFKMSLNNVNADHWCSYCGNNWKHCGKNDCEFCNNKSFQSHERSKYWHPTKNGDITPKDVLPSSNKKYWFHCTTCDHDFDKILNNISAGSWCRYCTHNWKHCGDEECEYCLSKSFKSHEKSKYWHPTKNTISSLYVAKSSGKKRWFTCDECSHVLYMSPNDIFNGSWCRYCSLRWSHCKDIHCKYCFDRSFLSHARSKYWNQEKNKIKPLFVAKTSGKKYWFDCKQCNHAFKATPTTILGGGWCGYCSLSWKHCKNNECEYCYNRSFKSHYRSEFFNKEKNNNQNPLYIIKSKNKKYWFTCDDCGNDFFSTLNNIVNRNSWCKFCKNKTEKKLYTWLGKKLEYDIIYQKSYDWCVNDKTNRKMPFDFVIEDFKIIIELDGDQHFKQISNWMSPEENQRRDILKMNHALKKGYKIIRIYQEDVLKNRNSWDIKLLKYIDNADEQITCIRSSKDYVNTVYKRYEGLLMSISEV